MVSILSNDRNSFSRQVLLLVVVPFLLTGCLSVKPSTSKSGKKYYEMFYAGEGGSQYHIKPLLFTNDSPSEDLLVDITFRYKNAIKDSAIVNFTIKSPVIYKSIDSLKLTNNATEVKNESVALLYNESGNKAFISRFTTKIALEDTKELFDNDDWHFVIYTKNEANKYRPQRKTEKAINTLRDKVFIIM